MAYARRLSRVLGRLVACEVAFSEGAAALRLPYGRVVIRRLARTFVENSRLRADRGLIGLDIGSSRIKALQFAPAGPPHRVAAFASEPVPEGAVADGAIVDAAAVSNTIRRLFERGGFRPAPVAAALPASAAVIKRITLPSMTADELDAAIPWEAEQHIPLPPAEVHLHYEPLGSPGVSTITTDVLLVAVRRERVQQLAGIIRDAGAVPSVVDVDALALRNAYIVNNPSDAAAVALLDIGASATTMTILLDGEPTVVRHIPGGGRAQTEALQAAFGLPRDAAEEAKTGLRAHQLAPAALATALHPVIDTLAAEVRSTFEFFRATTRADRIDRVVVSGGGSLLAGLAGALSEALHVTVDTLDPLLRASTTTVRPAPPSPAARRAAAVAVGLALRKEDPR